MQYSRNDYLRDQKRHSKINNQVHAPAAAARLTRDRYAWRSISAPSRHGSAQELRAIDKINTRRTSSDLAPKQLNSAHTHAYTRKRTFSSSRDISSADAPVAAPRLSSDPPNTSADDDDEDEVANRWTTVGS